MKITAKHTCLVYFHTQIQEHLGKENSDVAFGPLTPTFVSNH